MKNAGKARSYGLYRHLRTSKEIIEILLNYFFKTTKLDISAPKAQKYPAVSRVRGPQAANKFQSVFCGGVYVAKKHFARSMCRSPAYGGARR